MKTRPAKKDQKPSSKKSKQEGSGKRIGKSKPEKANNQLNKRIK